MKKIFLLLCFSVLVSGALAENKVIVIPLGDSTYQLTVDPVQNVSWYAGFTASVNEIVVTTVPAGKTLVLTHVLVNGDAFQTFGLIEDSAAKAVFQSPSIFSDISLGTGIPFSEGSKLKLTKESGPNAQVTLIGYLANN